MPLHRLAVISVLLLFPFLASADDKKNKFLISPQDNIKSILEKEIDLPVIVKLKSGADVSGTVVRVGSGVVQIAELSGMTYYDAVVKLDDISAVLFKVRKR
jgi:hypothetical protein